MYTLKIVQKDAQTVPPTPSDLANFGIHQIFRREAFRTVGYSRYLPLTELDKDTHDLPQEIYDRMKPALRLATLFVKLLTPKFARIMSAQVENCPLANGRRGLLLTDEWVDDVPDVTASFAKLCTNYRFTLLAEDEFPRSFCAVHDGVAGTSGLLTHIPEAKFDHVYPQTALRSSLLELFVAEEWETMCTEEKYNYYFMLATTLVHQLAHAVWIDRVLSRHPHEGFETGEIEICEPEARCRRNQMFAELGSEMELELFGCLPALPHFETPTIAERACMDDEPYKVLFALLDKNARHIDICQASNSTIYSFFDPQFWASLEENRFPNYVIELLANRRLPRRRLSNPLSDPTFLADFDAPIISVPLPGMFKNKPAITADNELVG
ncbi:hypothetical protein AYL99_03278 [Fonsecaea erecta]|uniref:Uncharacterized protein n=1 Tax=Fonsecaea erecta TaxID=1367422 RepID=A0A178ZMQ8_9EURO|nr:hypothetical protein AYL99_03278 [Fonsecaea erecta]OAP61077.1 hypothetical protein AYL99_03278 [Fonsecaea erecta]